MDYEEDLFEKIIQGKVHANVVYEDDTIIAFDWINPVSPIHILIIPKKKINTVNDIQKEDITLIGELFFVAKKIAKELNIYEKGYRLVFNINSFGGQHIFHLHLHFLAGRKFSWPPG